MEADSDSRRESFLMSPLRGREGGQSKWLRENERVKKKDESTGILIEVCLSGPMYDDTGFLIALKLQTSGCDTLMAVWFVILQR